MSGPRLQRSQSLPAGPSTRRMSPLWKLSCPGPVARWWHSAFTSLGKQQMEVRETPPRAKPSPQIPLSPRAHHGVLEGRAGDCGSCRPSLGSGSRRAPTVCATSWNMDLSRLSQSEGSLGDSGRALALSVPWLRAGTPARLSTPGAVSYLFVGRASR